MVIFSTRTRRCALALCALVVLHAGAAAAGPGKNPFSPVETVQVVRLAKASVAQPVSIPLDTCNAKDDSAKWQCIYSTGMASDCEIVGVSGCVVTVSCLAPAFDPELEQVSFSVESRSSEDTFPGVLEFVDAPEGCEGRRRALQSVPTPIYDAAVAGGADFFLMQKFVSYTPYNNDLDRTDQSATDASPALRAAITAGFGNCFYGECGSAQGWYISPEEAANGALGSLYGSYGSYGSYGIYGFYGVGAPTSTLVYLDGAGGIAGTFGEFPQPYTGDGPHYDENVSYDGNVFGTGALSACGVADGAEFSLFEDGPPTYFATTGLDGSFEHAEILQGVPPDRPTAKSFVRVPGSPLNDGCTDLSTGLSPKFDLQSMFVGPAAGTEYTEYTVAVNAVTSFSKEVYVRLGITGASPTTASASDRSLLWLGVEGLPSPAPNLFAYDFRAAYAAQAGQPAERAANAALVAADAFLTTTASSFGNLMLSLTPGYAGLSDAAAAAAVNSHARLLISALAELAVPMVLLGDDGPPDRRRGLLDSNQADFTTAASVTSYYQEVAPPGAGADFTTKAAAVGVATANLNGLIESAINSGASLEVVLLEISRVLIFADGGLADLVKQLGDGSLSMADFNSQTSPEALCASVPAVSVPGQGGGPRPAACPAVFPPGPAGFAPVFALPPASGGDDDDWEWGSTNATILFVVGMLVFVGLIGGAVFVMKGKESRVAQNGVVSV